MGKNNISKKIRCVPKIGSRFCRLVLIDIIRGPLFTVGKWKCDCGKTILCRIAAVKSGNTKSCGCLKIDICIKRSTSHGKCKWPEYDHWCRIINRCESPTNSRFSYYGGRGIKICRRWRHSFDNFISDMGRKPFPRASIDRIDNNGNYEPSNCRWANQTQQNNNKRNSVRLTFNGKTMTVAEWARERGVLQNALYARLRIGWSDEKILTVPIGYRNSK